VDGLDAIMSYCDASILDEISDDIAKLAMFIVKRWWASHGLPYVTDTFRVELEVRLFCYVVQCSWVVGTYFYSSALT
jgi:hypothetical protein